MKKVQKPETAKRRRSTPHNRSSYVWSPHRRLYVCRCGRSVERGVPKAQAGSETYTCKQCKRKKGSAA